MFLLFVLVQPSFSWDIFYPYDEWEVKKAWLHCSASYYVETDPVAVERYTCGRCIWVLNIGTLQSVMFYVNMIWSELIGVFRILLFCENFAGGRMGNKSTQSCSKSRLYGQNSSINLKNNQSSSQIDRHAKICFCFFVLEIYTTFELSTKTCEFKYSFF